MLTPENVKQELIDKVTTALSSLQAVVETVQLTEIQSSVIDEARFELATLKEELEAIKL